MIGKIKKFFVEVVLELKKVSWVTKKELMDSTWIVIISTACLGVFITSIDLVLAKFIELIIK